MSKLLFIHKDSQSASLSGSSNDKERALINSHVQAHRMHLRKTNLQLKPTSLRPRFLEFQRKRHIENTHGGTTVIADSNKENEELEVISSGVRSDDQDINNERPEEDFRLLENPFLTDDWTASMVTAGSQRLLDVRQHMRVFYSQKGLLRHLVPVATRHKGLLTSLAYISCSNLDALKNEGEAASSLVTKSIAVRAINKNLSDRSQAMSNENMLAVACLASGVNIYDVGVGEEYLMHRTGLESMAAAKVKADTPTQQPTGADKLFNRIIGLHRYILPCVYNLELPLPEYPAADYGYDGEDMSLDELSAGREMVSESPFYCPCPDYCYLQTSPYSNAETMDLLRDIRDYYTVLEEEKDSLDADVEAVLNRRLALRERILAHPSIYSASPGTGEIKAKVGQDVVFECIRLTSLVLIHLSDTCLPIRTAFALTTTVTDNKGISVKEKMLQPRPIRASSKDSYRRTIPLITSPPPSQLISHLAYALQKGPNPVVGWGFAMEGVLYWITTIGTAIARGRTEYRLFSSLNAKTIFDVTCSSDGRTWDEGFVPIQTFIKFQQLCLEAKITRLVEIREA